jgi:hypothetical protein
MSEETQSMDVESGTVALLNKSEIDMQIATAHRYPRSIKKFGDETFQMVTLNEGIAGSCVYALPRDGKTIEGPSARFAEIIASAWGNCRAGARVVSDQGDFVTAQGVFHDLERNVAITYEVQRRVTDKNGRRYKPDMIGVTANAACSIALRNAILKGVPKAFWDDMYNAARKTVMGDVKTLANRRADAIKSFQAYGISAAQILAKLEITGVEDITLEHLLTLRGLLTAIREGDTTPEQAFEPAQNGQGNGKPSFPPMPENHIASKKSALQKLIDSGQTADKLLLTLISKYTVSDAQRAEILAMKPTPKPESAGLSQEDKDEFLSGMEAAESYQTTVKESTKCD